MVGFEEEHGIPRWRTNPYSYACLIEHVGYYQQARVMAGTRGKGESIKALEGSWRRAFKGILECITEKGHSHAQRRIAQTT